LREGEKGLLVADYLHAHVWVWDGEEEQARCWHLLVRREVGADSISHYCLSNAPLDTLGKSWQGCRRNDSSLNTVSRGESECGMADYQVRRWMPGTIIWLWRCWERYFWLNRKKPGGNSGPCCHQRFGHSA